MPMDPPEGPGMAIRTCPERRLIRSGADPLVRLFQDRDAGDGF